MTESPYAPGGGLWYLEGFIDDRRRLHRLPILGLPFRVGRRSDQDLTLISSAVSSCHAEIRARGNELELVDLGSTNGTLLNGHPVSEPVPLAEGDIVHFATLEFRLGALSPGRTQALLGATTEISRPLPTRLIERTVRFRELLEQEAVAVHLQPIVSLDDRCTVAYEALGRSRLESLPSNSSELFEIAGVVGAEVQLSRLFRRRAVAECRRLPAELLYFLNTHPAELREPGLLDSLARLRAESPDLRLVLELHEEAITDPQEVLALRRGLEDLGIRLAYDDFGAGQARLAELAAAPPDFLKFDRRMVAGPDTEDASRRRLLAALVEMASGLGIQTIAEGIENEAEAAMCEQAGFPFGQGFLFGAPAPPEQAAGSNPA